MIGQTISRFRVISKLGQGGMGEVYLAEDAKLGRKLAIKLLPEQFTSDPDRVRRFEQEARAASALNHPNIITIYEIGAHEGAHFIATEFIEGDTLRDKLRRGRMELTDTLEIAVQCLNALQAAHGAGIVHRDIKPENIMVRPDGIVKVLDFGLAKLTAFEGATDDLEGPTKSLFETKPGLVMGTIAYMSPEQARGQRIDGRTDIFSFGVVLYEMIAGLRPFAGNTVSDQIAALLTYEPVRLSAHLPGVPAELEQIVARMLVKDRDQRYASAREVLTDLKRVRAKLELGGEEATTKELPPQRSSTPPELSYDTNVGQPLSYETSKVPVSSPVPTGNAPLRTAALTEATTTPAAPAAVAATPANSKFKWAALAVALLAGVVAAFWAYSAVNKADKVDSIAVLPFTASPMNADYLSDGVTEEVINGLSQLPELSVIARNSIIRYKGQNADPATVGKELDVKAVLLGKIARQGDDLLIDAELIDTRNRRVWGQRFARKLKDLISIQEDIARGVAEKLKLQLPPAVANALAKRETSNGEAYELYLKGRYYWNQGTVESMKKADELFEEAFHKDSSFAAAAAGCAACHAAGADQEPPSKVMPKAKAVALAVLKLDDKQADPHLTLAAVNLRYDWDFATAERSFKRALELEPKNPLTHQRYAEFLALMGRHSEAMSAIWQARALDPRSLPVNTDIGTFSYYAQDYTHAVEHFQKTLKLDDDFSTAHTGLGLTYEQKGQTQEAVMELLKAKFLMREPQDYLAGLKQAFAESGAKGFWQIELQHLTAKAQEHYVPPSAIAAVHARLGDKDKAFAALQQGLVEKDGGMVELKVAPVFKSLRGEARFAELLKKVGLTQ